jgi:hypothetical protein
MPILQSERGQSAYKEANQLIAIFLKSIETAKPVRLASAGQAK